MLQENSGKLQVLQESESAAVANSAELRSQVQELEDAAAKQAEAFAAERKLLQSNLTREQEAIQDRCQTELQEVRDSLRTDCSQKLQALQESQGNAPSTSEALQLQVKELQSQV